MNKNLSYISEHRQKFNTGDSYLLAEFLSFVEDAKDARIECSYKVSGEKVHANRFNLWFARPLDATPLKKVMDFFAALQTKEKVRLNTELFDQFYDDAFDWNKIKYFVFGVDLREESSSSRLKIWFVVEDYPEKIEAAIQLYGEDGDLRSLIFHSELLIGFDFYLNGRNVVKVYPDITKSELEQPYIQKQLAGALHSSSLEFISQCKWLHVNFAKNNSSKALHYHTSDPASLLQKVNTRAANQIFNYYKEKDLHAAVISFYEHELKEQTILNWNFYYMFEPFLNPLSSLNWDYQA